MSRSLALLCGTFLMLVFAPLACQAKHTNRKHIHIHIIRIKMYYNIWFSNELHLHFFFFFFIPKGRRQWCFWMKSRECLFYGNGWTDCVGPMTGKKRLRQLLYMAGWLSCGWVVVNGSEWLSNRQKMTGYGLQHGAHSKRTQQTLRIICPGNGWVYIFCCCCCCYRCCWFWRINTMLLISRPLFQSDSGNNT